MSTQYTVTLTEDSRKLIAKALSELIKNYNTVYETESSAFDAFTEISYLSLIFNSPERLKNHSKDPL